MYMYIYINIYIYILSTPNPPINSKLLTFARETLVARP